MGPQTLLSKHEIIHPGENLTSIKNVEEASITAINFHSIGKPIRARDLIYDCGTVENSFLLQSSTRLQSQQQESL